MTFEQMNDKIAFIGAIAILLAAMAGCSNFEDNNTRTPIDQDNTPPSPTNISPTTTDEINSETTSEPEPFTSKEKYGYFRDAYIDGLTDNDVNVTVTSRDMDNETLILEYQMENPRSNETRSNESRAIAKGYAATVNGYLNESRDWTDESWIPKHVNVTATTSDERIHHTGHMEFEDAKKVSNGEMRISKFILKYYSTFEPGPAHTNYGH